MTRFIGGTATTLTTQTFNSSQNWTVPAGVTSLAVLQGKGEDGSPDSYATETFDLLLPDFGVTPGTTPRSVSTDYNAAMTQANKFNGSGKRTVSFNVRSVTIDSDGSASASDSPSSAAVSGSPSISSGGGSGTWTADLSAFANYVQVSILVNQNDGYVGSSSSAFGYTFSGSSRTASVVTYNNVVVTPGQTYSINVAPGGFVTVQYYQP